MSFQQGLSGLNSSAKALDVISNNVANGSTVGFKGSTAHFADVFANSLAGGGASNIGIGSTLAAVQQQFTQGNLTATNNPLDIAINGGGFFRMSQGGTISFSRNGQFHMDKDGYVINDKGARLTGYPADATGTIVPSSPADLQLSAASIPPVATGTSTGSGFKGVSAELNFDSRATVPTVLWTDPAAIPPAPPLAGTPAQPPSTQTYNYSTALSIYDSLGNPHTLTMFFVRGTPTAAETTAGAAGAWDVHFQVDGTSAANVTVIDPAAAAAAADAEAAAIAKATAAGATPADIAAAGAAAEASILGSQRLTFDSSGKLLTKPISAANFSIDLDDVADDLAIKTPGTTNNANPQLSFALDFTGTSQYGASFATNGLGQDGYASGRLTGLNVGADGIILGRYSNGQSQNLAQVVLANFTNPNGLTSIGGNQWVDTADSGPPLVGAPNTGSLGVLTSSAVEESNVDMTAELVAMITQQRSYQANAQSIKTQDSILQTLVNLR